MSQKFYSTQPEKSILVLSGVKGDTRRYRALHLIEQMRLCGVDARFVHMTDQNFTKELDSRKWDMVIFQRVAYVKFLGKVIEGLQKKNILMVSDFDDLIFDPSVFEFINSPDFADNIRSSLYKDTMQRIRGMLDCTQGVLASTDYLAGQIRRLNKPVWVHRNAFSLRMLKISEEVRSAARTRDPHKVVIGYGSGTPTHNRDFEMIRPALKTVLLKYPQAELRLIGPLDPGTDWQGVEQRISRVKLVPWSKLPWLLGDFDINLAPLMTDNPFAQSKSEIKWMEAGMVNVPTVASPTDAYAFAIRPGENGFLANTQDEWVETLSNLIEDAELRNQVGKRALDTILADYHPAARAKELVDRLEDINQICMGKAFWSEAKPEQESITARVQKAADEGGWVPEQFEKGPSYLQMGLYTLRTTGILATIQFMWIFFRRMISPIIPFNKEKQKSKTMCKPALSICIVTYKVRDLLSDCLRSIYQNPPGIPFEIIVVDNYSQDGTVELLRSDFPQVRFVENQKNEGYTLPMNTALKMGIGQYLVQLNPDTLVIPGAFDRLVCFLEEHPRVGICTPKVLNRDGTLQKQCRRSAGRPWDAFTYFSGLSKRFPNNPRFAGYLMTYLDDTVVNEVEAVSGSCMMIRRELIEQIGYLDELFFAYQEDTDFCFRARKADWKIYYVPDAQIYHYGGEGGSGVEVYRSIYQWHRSYFLYFRKHLAREYFFLFNWFIYLLIGLKLTLTIGFTMLRKKKYAGTKKP